MGRCGRAGVWLSLASGWLAACQPLPHPFAEDRPPAALLRKRDSIGVSIAPIQGKPAALAQKLSAAVVSELQKHEIPATEKTASLGSYELYGRLEATQPRRGISEIAAHWRLYDAAGKILGEPVVRLAVPEPKRAADGALVERMAAQTAQLLMPLFEDETARRDDQDAGPPLPPISKDAFSITVNDNATPVGEVGPGRVAVGRIRGAPGDGGDSLAKAVAAVLKRREVDLIADPKAADLTIDGEVSLTPAKPDKQHVKIVWRVRRRDGAQIGTVGQENDIPRGLLDHAWGDVAYSVATAAGDGLVALLARGGASAQRS